MDLARTAAAEIRALKREEDDWCGQLSSDAPVFVYCAYARFERAQGLRAALQE